MTKKKKTKEIVKKEKKSTPVKEIRAKKLRRTSNIARFKGSTIIELDGRWVEMTSERFAEACYNEFGDGLSRSAVSDLEHLFRTTAPDMSDKSHLIAFGGGVWDMKKLDWTSEYTVDECVYRVGAMPQGSYEDADFMEDGRIKFVLDLANGDEGVYDDIMQSVAPLIMHRKPTGVIWYLGGGANGKSTLVHLLYRIFGNYLTELTVGQLEDERDTPQLNGKLGNVCKESSEGFVEDTRTYKSIGTHENFMVHKFHSQDMIEIEGNVHHIFSANNIPTFGDKSYGARRRTLVIPFNNTFKPDETFEDRTFTEDFEDAFLAEMMKYAQRIGDNQFRYEFSDTTVQVKEKYDTEANTAQTYAEELIKHEIYGFRNFRMLRVDYENWCDEHGYRPSSINVLRRAMDEHDFFRQSARDENDRVHKIYVHGKTDVPNLESVEGRTGLYQIKDSEHAEKVEKLSENKQEEMLEGWGKSTGHHEEDEAKQPELGDLKF